MSFAPSLPSGDRTGRFGVMYVRSLLAQAGVGHEETASGEDHLAVDLNLNFPMGTVRAQVKCGTQARNQDGSLSVSTSAKWREKWAGMAIPVYLIYVRLDKIPSDDWVDNFPLSTTTYAHAHWARVNRVLSPTVTLPASNLLTAHTFEAWATTFASEFQGAIER